jgi:hypothetical protein
MKRNLTFSEINFKKKKKYIGRLKDQKDEKVNIQIP